MKCHISVESKQPNVFTDLTKELAGQVESVSHVGWVNKLVTIIEMCAM